MLGSNAFGWLTALALLSSAINSRAQVRANGYIDPAFNAPCFAGIAAPTTTRALLVQPNGRILAGGSFALSCGNALTRLQLNGATDTTFLSPLRPGDFVSSIATQSNGKIIIGGRLSDTTTIFPVARLGASGAMDATFAHLTGTPRAANALVVQPDDKVVAVGSFNSTAGFITRFNSNGTSDNTFSNGVVTGVSPNGLGFSAVALQLDKVLVGGSFSIFTGGGANINRGGLARLNSDGSLDVLFRPPLTNSDVRALLLQPDGKILVAGRFVADGGDNRFITRLNSDGTRDTSFVSLNGLTITGLALALEADGKILVAHDFGVVRLTAGGLIDTNFGPLNADSFLGTRAENASALARSPDGNLLVGATRVTVNATERRGVVRLFDNVLPAPVIIQQPFSQIVDAGTNVTFSVMATGVAPIVFQWRKNRINIPGETTDTLTLTDVDSLDAGDYTVVASVQGSSVTSIVAHLDVNFFVSQIAVVVNGSGTVTPNLNGKFLEIGRAFTLTAKPARRFLFTNWSGFETSSSPVLTFVMQTNEFLQANFVPSPFVPVLGAYTGLFYDPAAPAHESAGAFALTLDDVGGFRGTVKMGTKLRKFAGRFSLDRVATANIAATTTAPAIGLALEIDTVNGTIGGTVTIGTNVSTVFAFRSALNARLNPAPNNGIYNAALPGVDEAEPGPSGDGFSVLTVSTAGRVSGRGFLADGSSWSIVSATSAEAWVPVYVPLYAGRGSIFGWITVTNDVVNDVAGTLWWTKPGAVGGVIHPAGFTNRTDTLGSRFTTVPRGAPVLALAPGIVSVSEGNLGSASFTNSFTLLGDNKIVGDNQLSLLLSTKGAMTGSFTDPLANRKRLVKGVALPKQNAARGYFLGVNESGRVFVGE